MKAFNKDKALRKLRFKQNKNTYIKRISIVLSCIILVVAIILFTFAKYESNQEYTLINGRVSEYMQDVNIVGIYVDNVAVQSIPLKTDGKLFDRAECTNNATASWDDNEWGINIRNLTGKTKCTLYFNAKPYDIISGDLNTVGSVVKIANEEFYVIGQEESTHVKLLSKWNLNVGSNAKGTATGLQDSAVRGYRSDGGTEYGTVAFSNTNYWYDSSTSSLKPAYGSSYPAYVYDSNSTLYQYVDNYVTYLTNQGVNVSGRLIKQEELIGLECSSSNRGCSSEFGGTAPEWVYQTSYWSGSASDSIRLWYVRSGGGFGNYSCDRGGDYGVRPVIILEI